MHEFPTHRTKFLSKEIEKKISHVKVVETRTRRRNMLVENDFFIE